MQIIGGIYELAIGPISQPIHLCHTTAQFNWRFYFRDRCSLSALNLSLCVT